MHTAAQNALVMLPSLLCFAEEPFGLLSLKVVPCSAVALYDEDVFRLISQKVGCQNEGLFCSGFDAPVCVGVEAVSIAVPV